MRTARGLGSPLKAIPCMACQAAAQGAHAWLPGSSMGDPGGFAEYYVHEAC